MLTITAISGWAIPDAWFANQIKNAFPSSNLKVVYPENPENSEEAKYILNQSQTELYLGYSLGSLWLLKYQTYLPLNCKKAIIAPILSFLKKANLGGKTSESQLKYLIKILARNSNQMEVLRNFYYNADLPYPESQLHAIRDKNILLRGLEFLQNSSVTGKETNEFLCIIGENDIFIDAETLKGHIPHLKIVSGVGHSPTPLLNHLAKVLEDRKLLNIK